MLMRRDPQISRTREIAKKLKTQENCEEHVFKIKLNILVWVLTREFL